MSHPQGYSNPHPDTIHKESLCILISTSDISHLKTPKSYRPKSSVWEWKYIRVRSLSHHHDQPVCFTFSPYNVTFSTADLQTWKPRFRISPCLGSFLVSVAALWHATLHSVRSSSYLWQLALFIKDHYGMKEWAYIQEVDRQCHLLLLGSRKDCKQISIFAPTTQNRFPAASSWGSESCLEQRVNSWQEAIKVSFIHSHYCFYVFAIMFIDMFEQSTSCSSVQLPVKMGHLSRNKPRSF